MQPFYAETLLPAGAHWSFVMRSGSALTLTDMEGGANVSLLLFNAAAENLLERLEPAGHAQMPAHRPAHRRPLPLLGHGPHVLAALTADSCGWHDSVCGTLNAAQTAARYGVSDYQQARNLRHQNGYDSFLVELAKYGLGQRDMAACLNLFAQVRADDSGRLTLERQGQAGAQVRLRFAMDTLVLLHTCPHPLSPASDYPRQPLQLTLDAQRAPLPEICLQRAENQRGLRNNALYQLQGEV